MDESSVELQKQGDVGSVDEKFVEDTIFNSFSRREKRAIMLTSGAIGILTPFTDTIYLPALDNVQHDFSASAASVAATVSAYLAAVGVGQLFFGPLSDRYGRLPVIYGGLLSYEAITIACVFAPSMDALIGLRTLEGFFVSSSVVAAQAIIADVFAPAERGAAMGAFMGPLLIGPVIAPLIGGALAGAYGWRSTFVLLAILTVPIVILTLIFIRHETHHYFRARHLAQHKPPAALESAASAASAAAAAAAAHIPPRLMMPWEPLAFALDAQLAPYYGIVASSFCGMFTSLTLLPIYLARPPYSLSPAIIGVTYVPVGVAMFFGSAAGGALSDYSLRRYGAHSPDGRMTLVLWGLWAIPPGTVAFGFALGGGASLGGVLVAQCVLGFGQAMLMPSTMGYLSSARQEQAGAAGSVLLFLCFVASAVGISVSVPVAEAVGVGWYFVIVAAVIAAVAAWATAVNLRRIAGRGGGGGGAGEADPAARPAAAAAAASAAAAPGGGGAAAVGESTSSAEWVWGAGPAGDGDGVVEAVGVGDSDITAVTSAGAVMELSEPLAVFSESDVAAGHLRAAAAVAAAGGPGAV